MAPDHTASSPTTQPLVCACAAPAHSITWRGTPLGTRWASHYLCAHNNGERGVRCSLSIERESNTHKIFE